MGDIFLSMRALFDNDLLHLFCHEMNVIEFLTSFAGIVDISFWTIMKLISNKIESLWVPFRFFASHTSLTIDKTFLLLLSGFAKRNVIVRLEFETRFLLFLIKSSDRAGTKARCSRCSLFSFHFYISLSPRLVMKRKHQSWTFYHWKVFIEKFSMALPDLFTNLCSFSSNILDIISFLCLTMFLLYPVFQVSLLTLV